MSAPIVAATRKSPLALAQAHIIADALQAHGMPCDLKPLSTAGDEETSRPLADIGGKELFAGALRAALLRGEADIAVHSLKDLSARQHPEFTLAAVGFADDARDVFISRGRTLEDMHEGASVGTCGPRRAALLACRRPGLKATPMRGNVHTRLQKMADGACDGVMLAAAGLRRLNLMSADGKFLGDSALYEGLCCEILSAEEFIPAAGQGMLAVECAAGAKALAGRIAAVSDLESRRRAAAERAFVAALGGDCHTPAGAHAKTEDSSVILHGFYAGDGIFRETRARISCSAGAAPDSQIAEIERTARDAALALLR